MAIKENPRVVFVNREQTFRFSLSGLQPLTKHYLYVERRLIESAKIKPVDGKVGDELYTDADGKLVFDYYYDSGITNDTTPLTEAQRIAHLVAGNKEVVVTTTLASSLQTGFEKEAVSYFISHILVQVYIPPESDFAQINVTR